MAVNGSELQVVNKPMDMIVSERPLTVAEVLARSRLVRDVVKEVMREGKHYGKIPGCGEKACLYQAGAQQLAVTFNLAPDPNIVNIIDTFDEYTVTVKMGLYSFGVCVASALGLASSMEEKYHWRKTVCTEEFDSTPENKRRLKWKKGWNGAPATKDQQIMVNPKDIANTVLKMSVKRAFVAATISATGASDQFTQDLEDMQKELLSDDDEHSEHQSKVKEKEKPQNDQQRQQAIKKMMTSIKKSCGNDAKKVADVLKALFLKKGINDCVLEELIEAQKILDAQANKIPNSEHPQNSSPNNKKSPLGNGKENGLCKQIVAKITTMFADKAEEWLKKEMNVTIEGLNGVDDMQLGLILECVDEKFKEFTAKNKL
jgi:hypothetical protein